MNVRLFPGDEIEGLTIRRRIGTGGSGSAYLVHNTRIGRDECMKVFSPSAHGGSGSERPWEEARRASATGIPGVVTVFSAGHIGDAPWFTMEYAPYGDLRGAVNRALPTGASARDRLELTMSLLGDAAEALDQLHTLEAPLVHGDVKPGNILVFAGTDGHPRAKLADFGLATTHVPEAGTSTAVAPVSGTLPYLAPERFHGEPPSPAADRYAFACTAYELLTGQQAFHLPDSSPSTDSTSRISLYRTAHTAEPRPRPGLINANLAKTDAVFNAALSVDPLRRPSSAREFHRRLASSLRIQGHRTTGDGRSKAPILAGVGVISIAALLIGGSVLMRSSDSSTPVEVAPEEAALPIARGCPQKDYLRNDVARGRDLELSEKYAPVIAPGIPDDCVFAPSQDALEFENSSSDTATTMIYIFNNPHSRTLALRDEALSKTVEGVNMTRESMQILTDTDLATLTATFQIDVPSLVPDDPGARSSACALSSQSGVLTVLQVNHGLDSENIITSGDGRNVKSQACGAAKQLLAAWMSDIN
ncbi:serine/threonine protein kinase [Corynebacterium freneyi]